MLTRLQLNNFRNYDSLELDLSPGVSVFSGENGQGKTNLLEAVSYLSLLRSFRTSRVDLLRQKGAEGFAIRGSISRDGLPDQRLAVIYDEKRRLEIDGVPAARASDFINSVICVPFVLDDVDMVSGPASGRRRFMNICLCQEVPLYMACLQRYNEAVKSRNAVLREVSRYGKGVLKAYDDLLVENGVPLLLLRQQFVEMLNLELDSLSGLFFHDDRVLRGRYASTVLKTGGSTDEATVKARFRELLESTAAKDAEDGYTRIGPHRDDLVLQLGDRQVSLYGSAGERRISALALRLASLEVLRNVVDDRSVVLLLDDVFGELDGERRADFFQALSHDQILVACTAMPPELDGQCSHYVVNNGTVTQA